MVRHPLDHGNELVLADGREDDAVEPAGDQVLDNRDLAGGVDFRLGGVPENLEVELLAGLDGPGVDRMPEGVIGALRHNAHDRQTAIARARCQARST